jgi:hypothetical protein
MPLSAPAPRKERQHRKIRTEGFLRDDGLWDIEGHLLDLKEYATENPYLGVVPPGEPIHEMHVRLTIDDAREIHAIEVAIDAHPYPICPQAVPNFQRLVGENVGRGFTARLHELVGRTQGCTHTVWLIQCCAITALHSIAGRVGWGWKGETVSVFGPTAPGQRSPLIGRCFAYAQDGMVVRDLFPEHYTGPQSVAAMTANGKNN